MYKPNVWYVLSNDKGTILAVYGSALCEHAKRRREEIERETSCGVWLHHILCMKQPHVGQTISMQGDVRG